MKKIGFLVLILVAFFLVSCEENGKDKADYYSEKFSNFKKEKLETKYTDSIEHNNFLTAVREFLRTMSSRPSSAEITKLITRYEKLLGDAETYINDFDLLSREYETYKQALSSKISDLEKDKNASQEELNELKKENAKLSNINQMQESIKSDLNEVAQLKGMNVKDTILEWLENNQYMVQVLDIAAKFVNLGGALWAIWGVLILAGALKDKMGPALQTAIWQIVGGIMIIVASSLFGKIVTISL